MNMTNEQILIASILDKDLAEVPESILPMTSKLQLAVQKAFLKNLRGPNIDALRRCVNALKNGSPYRGTAAYEALAKFQTRHETHNQEPHVFNYGDYKDPSLNFHTSDVIHGPVTTRETLTGLSDEGPWEHAIIQSKAFPDVYVHIHVIKDSGMPIWVCGFRGTCTDNSGYHLRASAVKNAIEVVKSEVRARTLEEYIQTKRT